MAVKTSRGGRYGKLTEANGYYGRAEAGQRHRAGSSDYGTKREFVGSGDKTFTFYSDTGGTLTVSASSYQEAWRMAKARGYKSRRRRRK